jgi:hypothetical protein
MSKMAAGKAMSKTRQPEEEVEGVDELSSGGL